VGKPLHELLLKGFAGKCRCQNSTSYTKPRRLNHSVCKWKEREWSADEHKKTTRNICQQAFIYQACTLLGSELFPDEQFQSIVEFRYMINV
jgi:hypothetical protein